MRIPGFVVPLEDSKDGLKEFLLVPYFGACIHSPPPPANQIIHVLPEHAGQGRASMDTVWVSGMLGHRADRHLHGRAELPHRGHQRGALQGAGPLMATPSRAAGDLARITFGVLVIGGAAGHHVLVCGPSWARDLGHDAGRGQLAADAARAARCCGAGAALAVLVMTLALLLLFVVPVTLAIVTIVDNADRLVDWAQRGQRLPPARHAAGLAGEGCRWSASISTAPGSRAAAGPARPAARLMPYAGDLTRWFVAEVGSVGVLLLQFLLTVVIAA